MIVIDASVWISYLVQQDVNHAATHPWLAKTLIDRTPIAVPVLLLPEVGGAIARRLGDVEMGNKAMGTLLAIPTLRLVGIDHVLGIHAGRIAADYRLRGADALYVAVAAQLGVPLVSWDKEHLTRVSDLITTFAPSSID
ncbi:MAG: type II toxin-antitoxin system VapC family toxin [Chloroflexi bacterium]|nr:type II toxin-antitoxin system VapC family toxin [Chloroflexota bacterium]